MGRIGIFGGSFNPPHIGHILAAEEMIQRLWLDRVYLVPAFAPPHKKLAPDSPDEQGRRRLLQLARQGHEKLEICDLELQRGGKSYTAETVQQLHALHPKDRLYLLVGTDMFLSLHTWYQPERIMQWCTVVLMRRQPSTPQQAEQLQAQKERLQREFGAEVIVVDNTYVDLSSTQVRRMLVFGCGREYLPPEVFEEIQRRHYYGAGVSLAGLSIEALRKKVVQLLNPSRVAPVLGCCSCAVELARRWGADETDAARAGLLHDITKALTPAEQLILCEKYDIITTNFEKENPKLLHAKTGAAIARQVFGENDAVCEAICWHTTGKENMTLLQKILYLADYMEPNRDFDGVQTLRKQAKKDLDLALYTALEMSMQMLEQNGTQVDYNSRAARDYMKQQLAQRS